MGEERFESKYLFEPVLTVWSEMTILLKPQSFQVNLMQFEFDHLPLEDRYVIMAG